MKGFLKRLLGVVLLSTTWWVCIIQFFSWLVRGKGVAIIDRYFEWMVFDLMDA